MNTEEAEKQLKPYLIGDLTPKEEAILEGHLDVNEAAQWYHQRYYRQTLPILEQPEGAPSEGVLEDLFAKAKKDIANPEVVVPPLGRAFKLEFSRYWKYAAVLLIAVGACLGIFLPKSTGPESAGTATAQNLNTLNEMKRQFAFGETIVANKGEVTKLSMADGVFIELSEGTEVRLSKSKFGEGKGAVDSIKAELIKGDVLISSSKSPDTRRFAAIQVVDAAAGTTIASALLIENDPVFTHVSSDEHGSHVEIYGGSVILADESYVSVVPSFSSEMINRTIAAFGGNTSLRADFTEKFLSGVVQEKKNTKISTTPVKLTKLSRRADGSVVFSVGGDANKTVVLKAKSDMKEHFNVDGKLIFASKIQGKNGEISRVYYDDGKTVRYFDLPLK